MPTRTMLLVLLVACVGAVPAAHAQEGTPSEGPAIEAPVAGAPADAPAPGTPDLAGESAVQRDWTIKLDPMVWWVSPSGELRLPSTGATAGNEVKLSDLNLDTPEFTPAGAVSIYADKFRFYFFGAGYSSESDATADTAFRLGDVAVSPGDEFTSTFDLGYYELTLGYCFWRHDWREESSNPAEAADVTLDLYGLVGGRLYDMDIGFESAGVTSGADQFFGDVIAGVRAEFTIIRDFSINIQGTGGGMGDSDRSSLSFDVQLFGEWRPWSNVGVIFGWRHTQYSFEDGEGAGRFEYDGSLAGVFGGVSIRF